jgi:hypothetical protein
MQPNTLKRRKYKGKNYVGNKNIRKKSRKIPVRIWDQLKIRIRIQIQKNHSGSTTLAQTLKCHLRYYAKSRVLSLLCRKNGVLRRTTIGNYFAMDSPSIKTNTNAGFQIRNRIRIRIRINLRCWIRIRIQIADPDPDPGGQK